MSTEVLLLSDVPSLGEAGAVVKVADGYARNYLLPRGLAGPVTPATRRRLEKLRQEREEQSRRQLEEARAQAGKLGKLSLTIRARTTDGRKLYGSVGAAEIVRAFAEQDVTVERGQIVLAAPLHEIGQFDVQIRLHAEVLATVKVWIVEE
jgi:large subunit ribosomal protein L9